MSSHEPSPLYSPYNDAIEKADTELEVLKIIAKLIVFKLFR